MNRSSYQSYVNRTTYEPYMSRTFYEHSVIRTFYKPYITMPFRNLMLPINFYEPHVTRTFYKPYVSRNFYKPYIWQEPHVTKTLHHLTEPARTSLLRNPSRAFHTPPSPNHESNEPIFGIEPSQPSNPVLRVALWHRREISSKAY